MAGAVQAAGLPGRAPGANPTQQKMRLGVIQPAFANDPPKPTHQTLLHDLGFPTFANLVIEKPFDDGRPSPSPLRDAPG